MLRHHLTLRKIAEELQPLLGARLVECFAQEKDSLVMMFYDFSVERYVHLNCSASLCSLYSSAKFSRARKNSVDLLPGIVGDTLQNIRVIQNERIVEFEFIHCSIFFLLFGGSASNVLVVNKGNEIIDSFKHSRQLVGTSFTLPEERLRQFQDFPADSTILNALAKSSLMLGRFYAAELCSRMNINPVEKIIDIKKEALSEIEMRAVQFKDEILNSKKHYILKNLNEDTVLSLIPLEAYPEQYQSSNSISELVYDYVRQGFSRQSYDRVFSSAIIVIERKLAKYEKILQKLLDEENNVSRSEKYQLWAELLISQPDVKSKHGDSIELTDWHGNSVLIPLDSKRNLQENSQAYFDKAKHSKEAAKVRKKRIPYIERVIEELKSIIEKLQKTISIKDILNLKKEYSRHFNMYDEKNDSRPEESKFRSFDLGDGYILYVGKNAANNDELTMKFAKPNDLWLHARGMGGSHAVLRMKSSEKPPKQILQQAASITAYYSQARKAKYTPVCYTQKKYVRKPKGANPGAVVISKEEVIMVEPSLPIGQDND